MNKNELIAIAADKAGITKADAAAAIDAVFDAIESTLKDGNDVRLIGFGTFSVSHRKATKGRNPATGAEIDIAPATVPKFKPGKSLKAAVNDEDGYGGVRKLK